MGNCIPYAIMDAITHLNRGTKGLFDSESVVMYEYVSFSIRR